MKIFYCILLLPFILGFDFYKAQTQDVEIQKVAKESKVAFRIKNMGFSVDGEFSSYNVNIKFNEQNLEISSFSGQIDVSSISTGNSTRDGHLQREPYFDAENFPKITFQSKKIISKTPKNILVIGTLTIKGMSKNVELPVSIEKIETSTKFKSSITINRRDFGVGGSSFTMADELEIFIEIIG